MGTVVRVAVSSNLEDTGYVIPRRNPFFDGAGGEKKFRGDFEGVSEEASRQLHSSSSMESFRRV